jgi:hypothetical protein
MSSQRKVGKPDQSEKRPYCNSNPCRFFWVKSEGTDRVMNYKLGDSLKYRPWRKLVFSAIAAVPLMTIIGVVIGLLFFSDLPQNLYMHSVRNIPFDCMTFSDDAYFYKMRPGPCALDNIEYRSTITHDADGFRNSRHPSEYEVAVIGDSHAYGWGVSDDQTFAHILASAHGYNTVNLAIPSYATMRELEALDRHGWRAKYVVLQYCDNDAGENVASLTMSREEFSADVRRSWQAYIASYRAGKAEGIIKPIRDLSVMLMQFSFRWKWSSQRRLADARDVPKEASVLAKILDRYRPLLEGKRLIVFESNPWGAFSPKFRDSVGEELGKLTWLQFRVLDAATALGPSDYYFLDDHLRPSGHSKLALLLSHEIRDWEKTHGR